MTRISVKQINQNELTSFVAIPIAQATGQLFNIIESGFAGVGSINGASGAVNILPSGNISIITNGNDIYIGYTGVSSGSSYGSGINLNELNSYLATGNFNLKDTVRTSGNQVITGIKQFFNKIQLVPSTTALQFESDGYITQGDDFIRIVPNLCELHYGDNEGVSLDWNQRILSGTWEMKNLSQPVSQYHLINLGFISGRTGITGTTNFITTSGSNPTQINLSTNINSGSNVIYVSKSNTATDNRAGLSKYDFNRPFVTITGAEFYADSGDLINVLPGLYTDYNLGKNGLNYYFYPGANIIVTGDTSALLERFIFTDKNSGISFNVYGFGYFENYDANTSSTSSATISVLRTQNQNANINFEFNEAVCGAINAPLSSPIAFYLDQYNKINIKGEKVDIKTNGGGVYCFSTKSGSILTLETNHIVARGSWVAIKAAQDRNSIAYINSNTITSYNSDAITADSKGDTYATANLIECLDPTIGQAVHSSAAGNFFVDAKKIISSGDAAVWLSGRVRVKTFEAISLNNAPAVYVSSSTTGYIEGKFISYGTNQSTIAMARNSLLEVQNSVLIANGTGMAVTRFSSAGGTPPIVKIYSAWSNRPINSNVTQSPVGVLNVSPEVT